MIGSSASFVHRNLPEIFCYAVLQGFYALTMTPQRPVDRRIALGAHAVFEAGRKAGLTDEQVFDDLEQKVREMHHSAVNSEKTVVFYKATSLPKNIHQ